jgi:hypothetical protein
MLPTDWVYGGWAASGEIDIMEYLGHATNKATGAIHYGGEWPANTYWTRAYFLQGGDTFDAGMHDFSLEWTPHQLRWYIDGQRYACTSDWRSEGNDYPAPFDEDFHLLLNMAVGGNLPGNPDATTPFPQDLVVDHVRVYQRPEFPDCSLLFEGMDHGNPLGNGWFKFDGDVGSGFITGWAPEPSIEGCNAAQRASFSSGGTPGFVGGFGKQRKMDLGAQTHFEFWIDPDAGQDYTIEINLQDDDNGDDSIPGTPDGQDDEFQFDCHVSPAGPCAIAGGGWQKVSIPFSDFYDDNSLHFGGNGIFDPVPVSGGGNGRMINVVLALISNSGDPITFRSDNWMFTTRQTSIAGRVWDDADGNGIQDAGESGRSGVDVRLLAADDTVLETATTDFDGDYQFAELTSGLHRVAIDTATLPSGATPTHDPDGVGTHDEAELVLGCTESSTGQNFGYQSTLAPAPTDSLTVAKSGGDLQIGYDITCNASDHLLVYGSIGDFTSVTAADCSIGNSGTTTSTPPAGSIWFLVAGVEGGSWSSVGPSTAGERVLTGVEAACPAMSAQDTSATCP